MRSTASNQSFSFSLGPVLFSFFQNTDDVQFGELLILYLHYIYLNFFFFFFFSILGSVENFTELDIRQGKLFNFSYLINLIKNSDKFSKIPSHHVTFPVALSPASFIGLMTTQHSCTGLMTQPSFIGLMTQPSFIGP